MREWGDQWLRCHGSAKERLTKCSLRGATKALKKCPLAGVPKMSLPSRKQGQGRHPKDLQMV